MKKVILFFLIVVAVSILMYPISRVEGKERCERTGVITGTITFVDLVCDTILFVPRFVFTNLTGAGHGYRSRHDRHHYRHDSFHYRDDTAKKKRGGKKGKGKRN